MEETHLIEDFLQSLNINVFDFIGNNCLALSSWAEVELNNDVSVPVPL